MGICGLASQKAAKIVQVYELSAYEMRDADATGGEALNQLAYNVLANGKFINYYLSDGWGDVTKSVNCPYGRLSPSAGNWL
jgi:hypothetical protein